MFSNQKQSKMLRSLLVYEHKHIIEKTKASKLWSLCDELPRSLQHHNGVLSLVCARRGELNVNVRQGTAARVAVATT